LTPHRFVNYRCFVMDAEETRTGDLRDDLAAVVALRQLADRMEAAGVERAVRAGWTWSRIAEALGVTRQAVHKRYAKRISATTKGET
jgi:predicted transcriptional regulator